jgi:GNAT superfamily N-acetyltransferase
VKSVVEVRDSGTEGFTWTERPVSRPYRKDYDGVDAERPMSWATRFDTSRWGVLVARKGGKRVGGAVFAADTPGVDLLEGRRDLVVLWDIRVHPDARGRGVGTALFRAGERWAIARGCRELKIETQNVNAVACRFYARQGCELRRVNREAYPELPGEIQLLWHKRLRP